jgi:DNA polymerase III subunit delta
VVASKVGGYDGLPSHHSRSALKINADNLASQLSRTLPHICLVSGDEPLLVGEASALIRAKARSAGFTERELHFVERGFDWAALRDASRNLSLFADRKLVEIRLSGAPGEAGTATLVEFAEQPSADNMVLVITDKLDGKALAARWAAAIDKHGLIVQVWPVELLRLSTWVRERLAKHQLTVDAAGAAMIAERVEGNLLAAHQEVEKLALLHPAGALSADAVADAVVDSARYDTLQLGIAAMQGQLPRALKILDGLRQEDVDATLVLWGLKQDLTWMSRVAHAMRRGQSPDGAMNAEYVWRPRQTAMKQALTRMGNGAAQILHGLLVDAGNVDKAIKGARRSDPWLELQALVSRLAGAKLKRVA